MEPACRSLEGAAVDDREERPELVDLHAAILDEAVLRTPKNPLLGFTARAISTEIDVDGDEIHEARWFSRDELDAAFESGEVLPPYGISIAARLIERWYGKDLPTRSAF